MAAYLKLNRIHSPHYYYPADYGFPDLDFTPFTFNEHRLVNTTGIHDQLFKSIKKFILKFTTKLLPKQINVKRNNNGNDTADLQLKTTPITDDYRITNHVLGIGMNGKVIVCYDKITNEKFALKILQDSPNARREVELQWLARNCENIIKVIDVYDNTFKGNKCLLMVMECMEGGELFKLIQNRTKGIFTERKAAEIIRNICLAVAYLHSMDIAHRDLKLENLLYKTQGNKSILKLTDFGFAKRDLSSDPLQTPCYTPYFVAPEILVPGNYNKSCDMWSLGVITYLIISGHPPFYSSNRVVVISSGMKKRIKFGQFDFSKPEWNNVSQDAKDLICGLLKTDPNQRLTIQQVLKNKWIANYDQVPETPLYSNDDSGDDDVWINVKEEMKQSLKEMRNCDNEGICIKDLTNATNPLLLKRQQRIKQMQNS